MLVFRFDPRPHKTAVEELKQTHMTVLIFDVIFYALFDCRCEGRVERVGWYQTRLRGRDTRPTYVPNGMFSDTMVRQRRVAAAAPLVYVVIFRKIL